ncbi:hypothetical protein ECH_0600 [Ehrlichia chaffeensis str. Arkansas]|uniref:Uncharacterized protein n=1 Tax=Ehrlichia chaffeensis (strain ATCC CRL-10679 / Arkansas) TaxID=205920 RepID=Q2GGM2_EHRCR|nr:hypothetical protein ECH_0600 [Ehrlichia chaffeensis str. Arkansas]
MIDYNNLTFPNPVALTSVNVPAQYIASTILPSSSQKLKRERTVLALT